MWSSVGSDTNWGEQPLLIMLGVMLGRSGEAWGTN